MKKTKMFCLFLTVVMGCGLLLPYRPTGASRSFTRAPLERNHVPLELPGSSTPSTEPSTQSPAAPSIPAGADEPENEQGGSLPPPPASEPSSSSPVTSGPGEDEAVDGESAALFSPRSRYPARGGREGFIPPPAPSPSPSPAPSSPSGDDSPSSGGAETQQPLLPEAPGWLSADEARAYELLNEFRIENGVPPVQLHPELVAVARLKAQDMAENDYFSHISPLYGSPGKMVRNAGISYSAVAENISRAGNIFQAHLQLQYSTAGHRQIMLNANYSDVGIGVSRLQRTPGIVLVQIFIRR